MRAAVFSVQVIFLVLISTFVWSSRAVSQPRPEIPPVDVTGEHAAVIERSQRALLDFRLNEAERLIRRVISEEDVVPYAYYLYSSIAFWRAMVEDVEPAYEQFYNRSDSLLDRLGGVEDTQWNQFITAEANLQRAIVLGKTERFLRAAWTGRRVYHGYTALVEEYPNFYAAYLGMGLTHVLLGSLPDAYRWILARFGISGTVDEGLHQLQLAAERSQYNGPQARATLALIDIILNQERREGTEQLEELYHQYPESLMFAHLYGYSLYSSRRAGEAEDVLRQAQQKRDDPAYHFIDFVTFYLGEVFFVQNEFARAEREYRSFLENYEGKALIALARLRCGLALEMENEYESARTFYANITTERTFDSDEYSRRTANERLERAMTRVERELLRGRNYYEAGIYESAVELLQPLYERSDVPSEKRAEAAFYLGRVRQAQERLDDALSLYGYAAENPGDERDKWGPWSQFYIGMIYAGRGETAKARALFEQILRYEHEYSYRNALEQRVHTALDQL